MPRVALTLVAALAAAFAVFAPFTASSSRADTVIEASTLVNGYPQTLTFKVTAKADSDITGVTLAYAIKGRGTSALDQPKTLSPAKNLSTEVVLQVNSGNSYIPVGSDFVYHWEISTADGNTFKGPDQTFFYLPTGKDWKTVSNDFMTVYYHGDRESIANAYLKAGADTYEKIGKQLYGVTLKQLPVKVIMFGDEAESDQARPGTGGRFDAAVTTCGTKVTNDIVLVIPIACGSTDRTDTLRHEFGHILNETAGEGALGKLPAWLDEGAAVYAQSSPGDYQTAFLQAARQNRLIPFNQMSVAASNANLVGVFYGESWAMVSFLIQKQGPADFGKFMGTIKGGKRFDAALTEVYGFANLDAFETQFKASVGAASQASPTVRPTTAATATPRATTATTRTPTPRAAAAASSSNDDNSIGTGTIVIGGVAVLFVLAALFAMLISMMMANNRNTVARKAAAAAAQTAAPDDPPSSGAGSEWRPPDSTPGE